MNSQFARIRLAAAVLCGIALALAACNAVEDVREQPSTPVPLENEVVKGTITGLGYRRPLVLEDTGAQRCTDPANATGPKIYCKLSFFGNFDENVSHFSFGSLPLGTPYNITVKQQPYGKICNFTSSAQGVVAADADIDIQVSCVTDTTIPRYCLGGTIPQAVHDLPGLRITLSTEEGLKTLSNDPAAQPDGPLPPTGQSCWFAGSIFNSGSSLPIFRWYVTASYPGADGQLANCRVLGGAANTGSNDQGDNTVASLADVTNLSIPACSFSIGGTVGYSQPAGITYTPQTITGLALTLQDTSASTPKDASGTTVPAYVIPAAALATSTTTAAFTIGGTATPARFLSNSRALYDVQVSTQPAGQFCMVGALTTISVTPVSSSSVYPAGAQITTGASARLATVSLPLTNSVLNSNLVPWATFSDLTNLTVRCRALPGTAANPSAALAGTYQLTTIANAVNPTAGTNTTTTTRTRNFLTFFSDGSFIYATRTYLGGSGTYVTGSGVERGFYNYNTSTGVIAFTVLIDTNNTYVNAAPLGTTQTGISALPSLSLTGVAKTAGNPGRITALASTTTSSGTTTTTSWQLDEPSEVLGEMEGTWTTEDHRRVYIYNGSTTFGTHYGTAGAVNFGDACYFLYDLNGVPNYHVRNGYYARRGTSANGTGDTSGGSETSTGCPIGNTTPTTAAASLDYYAPSISQLPGYIWRLPGSQSGADGRSPSPNYFTIVPGATDTLTITASDQGVLQPATTVTFLRTRSN